MVLMIALFSTVYMSITQAAVVPYLTPLQSFGGSSVDVTTLVTITGDYTLEVEGTSGTQISVGGGYYTYAPTASGTVRFSQRNGKVYVYEGSVYKATISPDLTKISYPDIFSAANSSSSLTGIYDIRNLLQNPGFENASNTVWKCYDHNAANIAITSVSASGTSIRNGAVITETNALLFHKTARYLTQSIAAGTIKSNTYYKLAFKYKTNSANTSQDGAVFRADLGTTEKGTEIISTPTRTTANNTTITTFSETFKVGTINVSNPVWFCVERTANYNASSQKLEWYDNFTLVEGSLVAGITGASGSTATYLAGTAYAPENIVVDYVAGDYYDMTPQIVNPSFEDLQTNTITTIPGWTNTGSMQTQNNAASGSGWTKNGNLYAEKYTGSGTLSAASLSQTITNIPNGRYQMTLSGHANPNTSATGASAFAGAASTVIGAGGTYTVDNIAVSNGTLNIGFQLVAPINCNWTGVDNFKLYYYGPTPVLSAPQSTAAFTTSTNTATINLTGANLTNEITITVPSSHITLTGTNVTGSSPNYTIALVNANTLNSITATWGKAVNVSGNITFTSGTASKTVAVSTSDVESVALSGITLSSGGLNTPFAVGTTTYTAKAPADISNTTVIATSTPAVATVTNNGTTISASNTSVVLTGNSYNGANHTTDYTVNWGGNYTLADWAAGGSSNTDAILSVPTVYGWSANPTVTWQAANTSGNVRYNRF